MAKARTGTEIFARRRCKLMRSAAGKGGFNAALITKPVDVGYLSGFRGEDSFLLLGDGWACLVTDGRYGEQAAKECLGIEIVVRKGSMLDVLAGRLKQASARRIGIQAGDLRLLWHDRLKQALRGRSFVGLDEALAGLRIVKDAGEVAAIRKAVRVAEQAFRSLISGGAKSFIGRSEREVAADLDYRMRLAGAEKSAFETIVAAGAAGSQPHYRPRSRRIRRGDSVLIDWGAVVDDYCSDLTRVVFVGRIPPKVAEIYEVVLKAQQAGISAVKSGVSAGAVDAAARQVIVSAGCGESFVHSLGHGIGREIHELPVLARSVKQRLRSGMVTTVEPGIYLPGIGGVRIEDDVLVTGQGPRRLSRLPTAIKAMLLQ